MASYKAIRTACEAIIQLLTSNYSQDLFEGTPLDFQVYDHEDFKTPMNQGVSLYLYRLYVNDTYRIPPGRISPSGTRYDTKLPLDLHVILTVWAKDATTRLEIVAWMMRVLENTPILLSGFLNAVVDNTFFPEETIEVIIGQLSHEDMLRLWESLRPNEYHLSVPYLIRNVRIDSDQTVTRGMPVQERGFGFGTQELNSDV